MQFALGINLLGNTIFDAEYWYLWVIGIVAVGAAIKSFLIELFSDASANTSPLKNNPEQEEAVKFWELSKRAVQDNDMDAGRQALEMLGVDPDETPLDTTMPPANELACDNEMCGHRNKGNSTYCAMCGRPLVPGK